VDVEVASVITTVIPVAGLEIVAASILVAALAGGLEPAAVVFFEDVVSSADMVLLAAVLPVARSYSCWICSGIFFAAVVILAFVSAFEAAVPASCHVVVPAVPILAAAVSVASIVLPFVVVISAVSVFAVVLVAAAVIIAAVAAVATVVIVAVLATVVHFSTVTVLQTLVILGLIYRCYIFVALAAVAVLQLEAVVLVAAVVVL